MEFLNTQACPPAPHLRRGEAKSLDQTLEKLLLCWPSGYPTAALWAGVHSGVPGAGGGPLGGRQGRTTGPQFFQFMSANFNETCRMQDTLGDARILKTDSNFLGEATTQESGITI